MIRASLACSRRFAKNGNAEVQHRMRGHIVRGFSLLEALIVLTILCVAGAAAVPHFYGWRSNTCLRSAVNELKENLESAKTLAAKDNTTIWVEFVPNASQYRLTCKDREDNDIILKEEQLPSGVKIDDTHPAYTVTGNKTNFNSRGGAKNCTIVFTNASGKSKRIAISIIGKVEVKD
jgi:prepilin-type N-terminal cleavage/methylation domain-containing protein